jgi:hypothetical protein
VYTSESVGRLRVHKAASTQPKRQAWNFVASHAGTPIARSKSPGRRLAQTILCETQFGFTLCRLTRTGEAPLCGTRRHGRLRAPLVVSVAWFCRYS